VHEDAGERVDGEPGQPGGADRADGEDGDGGGPDRERDA
jgi:hypothetical protein